MKKTYKAMLAGLMAGLLAGPQWGYATVSGNYTDLLKPGEVVDRIPYSNGSGYSSVTVAPATTMGDSITRGVSAPYQMYVSSTIASSTTISTFTALVGATSVGSTTFPATWVQSGRSIRITARGRYSTTAAPVNWTWAVLLGTTSILTTGAVPAIAGQTNQYFDASCVLTISTTGASGTVNGSYSINVSSAGTLGGTANQLTYSTATAAAVAVDLTTQLTVNPTFLWGTSSASNSLTVNNVSVEYLN